jgi:hypothetical protein
MACESKSLSLLLAPPVRVHVDEADRLRGLHELRGLVEVAPVLVRSCAHVGYFTRSLVKMYRSLPKDLKRPVMN